MKISLFRPFATILTLGLSLLAPPTFADQLGKTPVKIFIMVGQSNMLGHGNISPATRKGTLEYVVQNDPSGTYQFVVDQDGDWAIREDVWIKDQYGNATGLTTGYGSEADANASLYPPYGSNTGPELGFGHIMGEFYEEQVLLVKAAWGGKSLGNDFLPPSSGPYPAPTAEGDTGFYYQEVLRLVNDATENLDTYFPDYDEAGGYEIVGFCWHQGFNDRVNEDFSAAYEANMVNFIQDIRSDLGVPNLPFVIATSAMDANGPAAYTTVETAQLAMANATNYPQFDGNLAVIDCRQNYSGWNHASLEFFQDAADSPVGQAFHWNRNAMTYLNIGISMADEMALLAPSPCPSRLRVSGGATSGVELDWLNWDNVPTSVQILRNGSELVAALPGSSTSFSDTSAPPGIHSYQLVFTMPGDPCEPLTATFDGSITELAAFRSAGDITLNWANAMPYPAIEIRRNGVVIEAAFSGTAETYLDTSAPASGRVVYQVMPTTGNTTPIEFQLNPFWDGGSVDILTDGNAVSNGGAGIWDTSTLNWDEGPSSHLPWNDISNVTAIFGGSGGTVTVADTGVTVGGLQFNTDDYLIAGGPITFGEAGDINVSTGTTEIATDIVGTTGLTKTGRGVLRPTFSDYSFSGDIDVQEGDLIFHSGSNDGVARSLGGGDFTGNIHIAENSSFQFYRDSSSGPQTFSGVISGDGNLRLAYKTTYNLTGANTYTGKTIVHGEFNGRTATLNVSSFNSVVSPPQMASSSLGVPRDAANGVVNIGRTSAQANAILNYTGPGETTDRVMNLVASGSSTKAVNNLGTGTLTFTKPWIGNNEPGFRVPITTNSDMILTGSLPGNPQYLQKRGSGRLSLSGPTNIWDYVQLLEGTLEIDSAISDGGAYINRPIATGPDNGGANFITVAAGTPVEVGMVVGHDRVSVGTTIVGIVDLAADPIVCEISEDANGPNLTDRGSIGFPGALGLCSSDVSKLRWLSNATLKYSGPTDSTNRGFTIDNGDTATWEIANGATNLEVSGGTASTSGKLIKTGDGTLTLFGTQAYTGSTTVSAGTLGLDGGSQTSAITVATGGSVGFTLGSPTTSTKSLNLTNGSVKITGTVDNASDYQLMAASAISGTPTLDIPISNYQLETRAGGTELWLAYTGIATDQYIIWAAVNAPGQNLGDDFDGDGVENGLEFVLGGDKDTNDFSKLPTLSVSDGNLIFSFNRPQTSASLTTTIETGTDLKNWPIIFTVGADTATSTAGVTVIQNSPAVGTDEVILSVVQAPGELMFARLKVVATMQAVTRP